MVRSTLPPPHHTKTHSPVGLPGAGLHPKRTMRGRKRMVEEVRRIVVCGKDARHTHCIWINCLHSILCTTECPSHLCRLCSLHLLHSHCTVLAIDAMYVRMYNIGLYTVIGSAAGSMSTHYCRHEVLGQTTYTIGPTYHEQYILQICTHIHILHTHILASHTIITLSTRMLQVCGVHAHLSIGKNAGIVSLKGPVEKGLGQTGVHHLLTGE